MTKSRFTHYTPDECAEIIVFAINGFSEGGHPQAELGNLRFFTQDYIKECLDRLLQSTRVSVFAKDRALYIINIINRGYINLP